MNQQLSLPNLLRSRLTMIATLTALKAGHLLKKGFGEKMEFSKKEGHHNLVTEWDKKSENLILESIQAHFPDHGFITEESGSIGEVKKGIVWIIDPLDGTVNFFHKIPQFAISIAAISELQVLASVIYNPMTDELFIAEKDHGAYLNGNPLKVSETAVLDAAICGTGLPYNVQENPLACLDHLYHFAKMGVPIRRMGSAAIDLAYVAAGRLDAFWEVSLNAWDFAAGMLMLEEAGGMLSNFEGLSLDPTKETAVVASNSILHDQILKKIKKTIDQVEKKSQET